MIDKLLRVTMAIVLVLAPGNTLLAQDNEEDDDRDLPNNADIDNIGNRDINDGGFLGLGNINFSSLEEEIQIGRTYSADLERQVQLVDDPIVTEYVNRVGQNLVRNSDAQVPFSFKVIDDDSINAMALPGGFVYINTGIIMTADEEAELAGVMALVTPCQKRSCWANCPDQRFGPFQSLARQGLRGSLRQRSSWRTSGPWSARRGTACRSAVR